MTNLLNNQYVVAVAGLLVGLALRQLSRVPARAIAGTAAGKLSRGWHYVRSNPRSSIAGVAAVIASFSPKYAMQITGLATGVGLLMTSDADAAPKQDGHA